MNWISNVVRPRIRSLLTTKREVPDNMWIKCPESGQMIFHKDLEANQFVVPGSNYHMRMASDVRLKSLFDEGFYEKVPLPTVVADPLKFRDGRRYTDRIRDAKAETSLDDAVLVGEGLLEGQTVVAAAQDFRFMGGSLGMAAGEAVIAGMLRAVELRAPFILFAASGGARMQEGILSLMQMPRTTIAVQRLREQGLPYIVVLTDPTTGGVTASYAMLGDIHIAEPGALICFAGPRVIQQTIREQLPDGFQRAEYLLEHGMIDMVVHRHELRATLARLANLLMVKRVEKPAEDEKPLLNGALVAASEADAGQEAAQGGEQMAMANGADDGALAGPAANGPVADNAATADTGSETAAAPEDVIALPPGKAAEGDAKGASGAKTAAGPTSTSD